MLFWSLLGERRTLVAMMKSFVLSQLLQSFRDLVFETLELGALHESKTAFTAGNTLQNHSLIFFVKAVSLVTKRGSYCGHESSPMLASSRGFINV